MVTVEIDSDASHDLRERGKRILSELGEEIVTARLLQGDTIGGLRLNFDCQPAMEPVDKEALLGVRRSFAGDPIAGNA